MLAPNAHLSAAYKEIVDPSVKTLWYPYGVSASSKLIGKTLISNVHRRPYQHLSNFENLRMNKWIELTLKQFPNDSVHSAVTSDSPTASRCIRICFGLQSKRFKNKESQLWDSPLVQKRSVYPKITYCQPGLAQIRPLKKEGKNKRRNTCSRSLSNSRRDENAEKHVSD